MFYIKMTICSILIITSLNGCIFGKIVAVPFHATGAIVNTVAPDIVGDSISGVGTVVDIVTPF